MEYQDHVETLRAEQPRLADQLAGLRGLENVLTWMKSQQIALSSIDVIAQDEYSHDLVIPWGPGGSYLAFGMT